jgi:hypothetical protein
MNKYAQDVDSPSTCEVCRNDWHLENDCPETHEHVAFMNNNNNNNNNNNGYRP